MQNREKKKVLAVVEDLLFTVKIMDAAKRVVLYAQFVKSEEDLLERAKAFHIEGNSYPTVNDALKAAMAAASKEDMILMCGSVFVVGEVDLSFDYTFAKFVTSLSCFYNFL